MDPLEKVRQALISAKHEDSIAAFADGTRTAADAAASVGCSVAQIAKSIVFRAGDDVILVIASGADRIDRAKVSAVLGRPVKSADPAWVMEKTGYAVGGVPPIGHDDGIVTILDEALLEFDPIWAAAGSPNHAFRTTPGELVRLSDARIVSVREA